MKLASFNDGTRDGCLTVVSRNLHCAIKADHIAPTLQAALDDWDYVSPQLEQLYNELNAGGSNRIFDLETIYLEDTLNGNIVKSWELDGRTAPLYKSRSIIEDKERLFSYSFG